MDRRLYISSVRSDGIAVFVDIRDEQGYRPIEVLEMSPELYAELGSPVLIDVDIKAP